MSDKPIYDDSLLREYIRGVPRSKKRRNKILEIYKRMFGKDEEETEKKEGYKYKGKYRSA